MKKKLFTMHVDLDDFLPATDSEKEYMVKMRPSTTFFKDGVKRLMRNKIAAISMFLILVIALMSIFVPMFWPYSYDAMLGVRPGKPVDPTYNNLKPFAYGASERVTLLGKLHGGQIFIPAELMTSSKDPEAKAASDAVRAQAKADAQALLDTFNASTRDKASFLALEGKLPAQAELTDLKNVSHKSIDDKNVIDWLWQVDAFGNAQRVAGDAQLFETNEALGTKYSGDPQQLPVVINNHNATEEIRMFVEALVKDEKMPISSAEGAYTVAVCRAALTSVKSGKPEAVKYPEV
jgi:hypothetical protein